MPSHTPTTQVIAPPMPEANLRARHLENLPPAAVNSTLPITQKRTMDKFFLQNPEYLPPVAGHWIGFTICDVKAIVVNHIIRLFLHRLKDYEAKVFYFFSELLVR
jgi:hypothetical protein